MQRSKLKKDQEDPIDSFIEKIMDGVRAWEDAGKLLVGLVAKNPDVLDDIVARNAGLDRRYLSFFLEIGEGSLAPRLLLVDGPGWKKLRAMPRSVQDKFLDDSVELLCPESGDVLLVGVGHLSMAAAKQVFSSNHVRSVAEQRAYLEALKALSVVDDAEVFDPPYKVVGKAVVFSRPCKLTRKEVANLIAQVS